jgi:hypothetical protein
VSGDGFLGRWSRLKRAQTKTVPPVAPVEPAPAPHLPAEPDKADPPKPAIRAEDLPPIDGLTMKSDISAFLQDGVPEELKNLALRKIWASDPFLANPDPLDIHNLDYSMPVLTEAVKTVYQVGRGIVLPEDEKPADVKPTESEAPSAPAATVSAVEPIPELPPPAAKPNASIPAVEEAEMAIKPAKMG